jgi:hypothetical protein
MTVGELCDRVIANEEEAEFLSQHVEGLSYSEQMALALLLEKRGQVRAAESVTRAAAGKLAERLPVMYGGKIAGWMGP